MKTKLISIVTLLLISAMSLQAQIEFGVQGGVNFQNLTGKDESGEKLENDLTLGFNLGAFARIPIAPDFYFQPGLLYSMKGTQFKPSLVKAASDDNVVVHLSYIEMPLNILFKPQIGNGHILVGFGPYIAYGISGKMKYKSDESDIVFKGTVKTGDDLSKMYMKGFDAGANIFAGYELPMGLFFSLNTQLGMLNLTPDYEGEDEGDSVIKNTGFGLTVGYCF